MNRETWLNELALKTAPRFAELGFPLPKFRVSVGFTSKGTGGSRIAECWSPNASADGHCEILIRPDQINPVDVAGSLVHELIHAAVGLKEGHTGKFRSVALAFGLKPPMTATTPGPAFIEYVEPLIAAVGPFPHAKLTWPTKGAARRSTAGEPGVEIKIDAGEYSSSGPPKQGTRMHKAICKECGYTVRVAKKWIDVGAPHCPAHGAMVVETEATVED